MIASAQATEQQRVLGHRHERFIELGFSVEDALELASQPIDWHEARKLVSGGCPLPLALRILLP